MTEAQSKHPDDETLLALSMGQLTEAELALVSVHLGDCPACCQRIDQLATRDRLLARLQESVGSQDGALVTPDQRRPAVRALRQASDSKVGLRRPAAQDAAPGQPPDPP